MVSLFLEVSSLTLLLLWILWEDLFVDMVRREGKKSIEVFVICCFMCMLKE